MPLRVLEHPLAAHIITHLRDHTTKPATFRTLAYQISLLLAIEAFFVATPKPLAGRRVIVTAGPPHEPIDPVRYITNRSSGKMGFAVASAARSFAG